MRTRIELILDSSGAVRIEASIDHDFCGRPGLLGVAERQLPDEDLAIEGRYSRRHPGLLLLNLQATCSGGFRFVDGSAKRFLNLADGSPDRHALSALAEQDQVRLVWPREDLEVVYSIPARDRDRWREALDSVAGISASEMYDELLEYGHPRSELLAFGVKPARSRGRRVAAPPQAPIGFFASRSGQVPRDGRPTVQGVRLPSGRRSPDSGPAYWVSDDPINDAPELAQRLAKGFPETGLWPLLWTCEDDPQSYMQHSGDPATIDAVDPEDLLRSRWEALAGANPLAVDPFGNRFPGLAAPTVAGARDAWAPFASLTHRSDAHVRLLIVPCNRPADAVTVLGGLACETEGPEISAVLRSWEERFEAVLIATAPSAALLAIGNPPSDAVKALQIAAELWSLCPPPEGGRRGGVQALADALAAEEPCSKRAVNNISPTLWKLAWYD